MYGIINSVLGFKGLTISDIYVNTQSLRWYLFTRATIEESQMFEDIINKQTTPENIKIYKQECNNNHLASDCMKIVIKNNKILESSYNNSRWEQRVIGYNRMIENCLKENKIKDCIIKIALGDQPKKGYFNFCRKKNETGYFLIPNFRFTIDNIVNTQYYDCLNNSLQWNDIIEYIYSNDKTKFQDKMSKMIFIGGNQHKQRKKYFEILYNNPNAIYDGYLWTQCHDKLANIGKSGKEFIHFKTYFNYKYTIYIDGSTNSDRLRLFLLLNSVPFYCKSSYEEFYTYLLKPNVNYIQFSDVSELSNIFTRCEQDSDLCNEIINNNKLFIENTLTTRNIYKYIADLLNKLN